MRDTMTINVNEKKIINLFYFSIIGLFISFGINFGAYFFLYSSALLGAGLLIYHHKNKYFILSNYFWVPIIFFLYVSITPGDFFKDLRIGGMMSAAFFSGLAAYTFFKEKFTILVYFLPIALVSYFIVHSAISLVFDQHFFAIGQYANRLTLSFSHPNVLGEMASFGILSLLCFPSTNNKLRLLEYALMAILGVMIFLSVGRSTYMGILAALLLFFTINFGKKAIFFLLIVLVAGMSALPILSDTEQKRITDMVLAPQNDPNFQCRLPMWIMAFDGFKESPVVGHSLRGFKQFYKEYMEVNYDRLKSVNKYTIKNPQAHPHSLYMTAIYSWGIVGSALLVAIFVMTARLSILDKQYFPIYTIVFMLAYGIFDVRFQSKTGDLFLFFPIGMAYAKFLRWKLAAGKYVTTI